MKATDKKNVYEIVTGRIIKKMEEGNCSPWEKPWKTHGLPVNHVTGRAYSGVNILLLLLTDYEIPRFLTYNQIKKLGAKIKSDQYKEWEIVTFCKPYMRKEINPKTNKEEEVEAFCYRYYKVWNIEQTDIDTSEYDIKTLDFQPIEKAEEIFAGYKDCPDIRNEGEKAYYHPDKDYIAIPDKRSFHSEEYYYETLFHEAIHSVGHKERLNRKTLTEVHRFGAEEYSKEELIASIGASFLCDISGITVTRKNNHAYINGWLSKLNNDPKLIVSAAAQAQKAVDYILGQKEQ